MSTQTAPKANDDATSDRLCQTLVGWILMASQKEYQAFQSRYTLAFATISFGIGMCTILVQNGSVVPGFLFLSCMVALSLGINHHYDRKNRAWFHTRLELETFAYYVSYYGAYAGQNRPIKIKTPHALWKEFYKEYFVRPLDLLSKLFYLIAMLVLIGTSYYIFSKYQFFIDFSIEARG